MSGMLIDLPVNGETRKALVTSGKLGILEAIDRTNGEWLWHKEMVPQNVVTAIDPKTGEKTINVGAHPAHRSAGHDLPGQSGRPRLAGDRLQSADRHALHAAQRVSAPTSRRSRSIPARPIRAAAARRFKFCAVPNSDGNFGRVDAIKLADRSTAWSHRQRAPSTSAVLPTGGGLVFAGDIARYFRAFDDTTGKVLWQMRTNNAVNSFPISYSVNGKQYVAVATGGGSGYTALDGAACDRDQESGWRLDAVGVRAAGR